MIVCERCLQAIEVHEGNQVKRKLDWDTDSHRIIYGFYFDDGEFIEDDDGAELVWCEFCEEYHLMEDMYEI